MCGRGGNPAQRGDQEGGGGESHVERSVPKCCSEGAIELNRIGGQRGTEVVMMMMLVVPQRIRTTRKVSIGDARTTLVNSPLAAEEKHKSRNGFTEYIFIIHDDFLVIIRLN
jgi:hypothetical protein